MADLRSVNREINKLDRNEVTVRVRSDLDEIQKLRAELEKIRDETVNIDLNTSTDPAALAADIERIKQQLRQIGDTEIGIDADTSDAIAEVARLVDLIEQTRALIRVGADTSAARREVRLLQQEINRLNSRIRIDVDRSQIDGLRDSLNSAHGAVGMGGGGGGGLMAGIIALIALLGPLSAAVLGAGAGLLGGFAVMGAAVGSFAAFAIPTIKDITENIKLLNDAAKETDPEKLKELNKKIKELKQSDPVMYKLASRAMVLKDRFLELSKAIRPQVLGIFANMLGTANILMGYTAPIAQEVATAVEKMTGRMNKALKGDDWRNYFAYVQENAGSFTEGFMSTMGNFMTGFANLIVQLDPLTKMMGGGFRKMSEDFLKWSRGLENNDSFQRFVAYMQEMGPKVWDALGSLSSVLIGVITDLAPLGEKILDLIIKFGDWYNALRDTNPELVETATQMGAIGLAVAALAGPIGAALGPVMGLLGGLAGIVPKLGALAPLLVGLSGPIGAIAGIAAIFTAIGGVLAFTNTKTSEFAGLMDSLKNLWDGLKKAGEDVWNVLKKLWEILKGSGVIEQFQVAFANLFDIFSKLLPILAPVAAVVGGVLLAAFVAFGYALRVVTDLLKILVDTVAWIVEKIVDFFVWLYETLVGHSIIPDLINSIIRWFKKLPGALVKLIVNLVKRIIQGFINMAQKIGEWVSKAKQWAVQRFQALVSSVVNKITGLKQKMSQIWNAIKTAISNVVSGIWSAVTSKFTAIKDFVTTKIGAMKDAIVGKFRDILSSAGNILGGIKDVITGAFSGAGSWLLDIGKDIIMGLVDGIADGFGWVKDKLGELGGLIPDWKGPPSYDKVMLRQNGAFIMQGLMHGIASEEGALHAQLAGISKSIDKTKFAMPMYTPVNGNALHGAGGFGGSGPRGSNTGHFRMRGNGGNHYEINVHVPVSANKAAVGKAIVEAIEAFERTGGRKKRTVGQPLGGGR